MRGILAGAALVAMILGVAACNARTAAAPPAPAATSSSPSPSPSASGSGGCTGTGPKATCGPFTDHGIAMSNGYDTYVGTNCWADPSCTFDLSALRPPGTSAAPWSVKATEPAGNTSVTSYPNEQQLTNNWCGSAWNGCASPTDTPLASLTSLTSSYSESMPHNKGTDAQAAWDIWLSGTTGPKEVMVWVDNVNRGDGGATQKATASFDGLDWTLYQYGNGELIWSLDGSGGAGTFAQQASGAVDLLKMLDWLARNGYESAGTSISQVDFGWEICSTGGQPETFTVNRYTLSGH